MVRIICIAVVLVCAESFVSVAAEPDAVVVSSNYRSLVPHRLLALLHAPEVHQELKLSSDQVRDLEAWFAQIDGPWFRSRIASPDAQMREQDQYEQSTLAWMQKNFSTSQCQRMRQLEWQTLGLRMLLRNDVAAELKLTARQQEQFAELARKTDQAEQAVQSASQKGKPTDSMVDAATKANQAEQNGLKSILKADQKKRMAEIAGPVFETQKLRRIYPMAPELIPTTEWVNSEPLTLRSLRGKVVLVHFYAFQCHNCHANFEIYRRWHDTLRDRGVVVIGIQTPETALEKDPKAITQAASEKKLEFPILMDLKSENWNAWGNTMWPTVYVIDKNGYLRQWWQGELNWQGATGDKSIEQTVEAALAEPDVS